MNRARILETNPLAAILEEALGVVLAPGVRGDVLAEAVELSGLDEVPDEPGAMRLFLEGPLFSVLARHMPVSDALELLAQVRSALELALDHADDPPRSDVRPVPLWMPRAVALVVTRGSEAPFLLADLLDEQLDVVAVASAAELRQHLLVNTPRLVVVDRRPPGVDPLVYDALLEHGSRETTIVLWSGTKEERLRDGALASRLRLVTTPAQLRLGDLGALCQDLLRG